MSIEADAIQHLVALTLAGNAGDEQARLKAEFFARLIKRTWGAEELARRTAAPPEPPGPRAA